MATQKETNEQILLPPADWAAEIEKLTDDLSAERDRHLRALADFKNYRRRIEREGNKIAEEAIRKLFLSLLDIIDDMEKALLWTSGGEQPLADGVKMIHLKLLALLEKEGVRPIESIGEKFDPEIHHAVAVVKRDGVEQGTIIEDLRRGYFWKKKLLRPAQVRIAG
jgi:molecular chaperone GrpE